MAARRPADYNRVVSAPTCRSSCWDCQPYIVPSLLLILVPLCSYLQNIHLLGLFHGLCNVDLRTRPCLRAALVPVAILLGLLMVLA
eukprot:5290973-Prymnesium_polylepis.1